MEGASPGRQFSPLTLVCGRYLGHFLSEFLLVLLCFSHCRSAVGRFRIDSDSVDGPIATDAAGQLTDDLHRVFLGEVDYFRSLFPCRFQSGRNAVHGKDSPCLE